jgi:ferric-dicitrate binding protein FerR (iron transport regulator)
MEATRGTLVLRLAAAILLSLAPIRASSAGDKILTNVRGDVSYVAYGTGSTHALAVAASIGLSDDDVAKTGTASMGTIVLADSSRVILASNTTVKVDVFDAVASSAHFVVFDGKMRFRVEHPSGARATFTFTTPAATIGVRGTEGDISADPADGVRVNVYHLSDPALPVVVTTIAGDRYDLTGGQKIWMRWQSGKLVARVTPLTKAELNRFSELGPPGTIDGGAPPQ